MVKQDDIKTIKELLQIGVDSKEIKYSIPNYQRGYKWKTQQVNALLDDLKEFLDSPAEAKFYCLQPIMVQKVDDRNKRG